MPSSFPFLYPSVGPLPAMVPGRYLSTFAPVPPNGSHDCFSSGESLGARRTWGPPCGKGPSLADFVEMREHHAAAHPWMSSRDSIGAKTAGEAKKLDHAFPRVGGN